MTTHSLIENISDYFGIDEEVNCNSEINLSESVNYFVWSGMPLQTADFAAKKKQRACKKGYPCGAGCISKNYACKKALKGQAKNFADYLKSSKKAGAKKKTKPPVEKKTKPPVEKKTKPPVEKKTKPPVEKKTKPPVEKKTKADKPKETKNWKEQIKTPEKDELGLQKEKSRDYLEVPAGTYTQNGKKIVVGEVDRKGEQNLKIDGVSPLSLKAYRDQALVAQAIDHYTAPMLGDEYSLGEKANAIRQRPPIKSKEEFEKEFNEAFDALDEEKDYDGLVPVYQVRRALGDRLTREEFDNYALELAEEDKFVPEGGSVEDSAPDKIYDSINTELDDLRCYFSRDTRNS